MTSATIKDLKPGNFVMIDGEPCKVVGFAKSKPGKHGAAKVRLEGMGIFDNRRRFLLKPASADVEVPEIDKRAAQVISVQGDIAQLMDLTDYATFDVSIPEEFKGKLEAGRDVLYWKIGGRLLIKELR
ncbi:MAG: translation initiation factor IF-5A [Candidatus Aenigmarchaeota archaeon]|nr:translation initiation factor IF-5A [Candidatus Aenigmarchaeota archaeon]